MRAANANAHRCAAFTPKVKAPISETLRARRAPIFVAERSEDGGKKKETDGSTGNDDANDGVDIGCGKVSCIRNELN